MVFPIVQRDKQEKRIIRFAPKLGAKRITSLSVKNKNKSTV